MILKTTKPVTPSQRQLIKLSRKTLRKQPLLKNCVKGRQNPSGRNNSGKITIRHKGGGHKKNYRIINFLRINPSAGIVCSVEYDPNRNANIASVFDPLEHKFFYILAPKNLNVGDIVKSGKNANENIGHSLPLFEIPVGSYIYNVSLKPSKLAQISRSAGTFSKLIEKTFDFAKIELSSGEQKFLSTKCYATIGIVSNELTFLTRLGKAGQSRWLNKRPSVRGVAMNPVDHPHGGGEGKKSGRGKTPWGRVQKKKSIKQKNKSITNVSNE
jgi:large subunit ribosomal protein L2